MTRFLTIALLSATALTAGCAYGPEHLPALYKEMAETQHLINCIEIVCGVPSRDPVLRAERAEKDLAFQQKYLNQGEQLSRSNP